ncbi:hypothetical protein [Lacunimicrobium album]
MKLSDELKDVISLSKATQEYYERELPKYHRNYPIVDMTEASPPVPKESKTLQEKLEKLGIKSVVEMLYIMYLGRGDFDVASLRDDLDSLDKNFTDKKRAIEQMTSKAPLSDYLEDGSEVLKENNIDLDKIRALSVSH